MAQLFANNAKGRLDSAITSTQTTITLQAGQGALFPSPTGSDFFLATLYRYGASGEIDHEIVRCIARSGDVLTVVRGQEGTTARDYDAGTPVELRLTSGSLSALNNDSVTTNTLAAFNATVGGDAVTTASNAQTLTNKALVDPVITLSADKTTPVDADEVVIRDSAAVFSIKKLTWANIKATLKTWIEAVGFTFGQPQSINVNSTSAALRITQTGSGNALVVEDSASPDSTPFVVNTEGKVFIGVGEGTARTSNDNGNSVGGVRLEVASSTVSTAAFTGIGSTTPRFSPGILFRRTRGTYEVPTAAVSSDYMGRIDWQGYDGVSSWADSALIFAAVDAAPTAGSVPGRLVFSTTSSGSSTPIERMRIDSAGRVSIGGVGNTGVNLTNRKSITGAATAIGYQLNATVMSDVTTAYGYRSSPTTEATAFTLASLIHFAAFPQSFGADSVVTNQYGFYVSNNHTGATNNYSFYSSVSAGTGRWNFYAAGTAANYFAGNTTLNAALIQTPTHSTAASGSTITLTSSTNHLLYDNPSPAASLTITLPSGAANGQIITIATRSEIVSLTINGGTVYGAPSTLPAGGFASFIYSTAANAWFRRG